MNYYEFRKHFLDLACFNNIQEFNRDSLSNRTCLTRWNQIVYLIRLRKGLYTFPEYLTNPDFLYCFC